MVRPGLLEKTALAPRTGAGVRVAIVDSGVHARHPHVGGVSGGVGIGMHGDLENGYTDTLGHGTAVTAVVREKAPAADILVARVFSGRLETTVAALAAAVRWAVEARAHLINLSLGTGDAAHAPLLQAVVHEAHESGAWVVAAGPDAGTIWLPGSLDGVVSVGLDWSLHRDQVMVDEVTTTGVRARAAGWPRPVPGVPPERNLHGLSFAVANVTGLLALVLQDEGTSRT